METKHCDASIKRIKETHFGVRPMLESALKKIEILSHTRDYFLDAETYHDFFDRSFGYRFFDMGTLIRLGNAVEMSFKSDYMAREGIKSHNDLQQNLPKGGARGRLVFQQLEKQLPKIYRAKFSIELKSHPEYKGVCELMVQKCLYSHHGGVITEHYLKDIERVTGKKIQSEFPHILEQDVYWFRPLNDLSRYIKSTDKFFNWLSKQ